MQVVETKSYWEEFYKNHPDPSYFREICLKHVSLLKILNFCHSDNILRYKSLKQYPFKEKVMELETITPQDIDYLYEMRMRGDRESEWFDYLANLFDLTARTLKMKHWLSVGKERTDRGLTQSQINEAIDLIFNNYIRQHDILIIKDVDGNNKTARRIGKDFPFHIEFHEKYYIKTRGKEIALQVYFPPLMEKKDIQAIAKKEKKEWDHYSVGSFKRYRNKPGIKDLCFLSKPDDNITIQYYYRGKPLFTEPFEFQTGKRYDPLLKKQMKELKKYKNLVKDITGYSPWDNTNQDNKEEVMSVDDILYTEVTAKLFKVMLDYDAENYDNPGSYFKAHLKHWGNELYEHYSTEEGERYCDKFCKADKELLKALPCQYETRGGHCINPDKKLKLKSKIEHSAGSLDDESFDSDGENKERRGDHFKDEKIPDPETIEQQKLKDAILEYAERDDRLKKILTSGKKRRSVKDQKYYERKKLEIRERFGIKE